MVRPPPAPTCRLCGQTMTEPTLALGSIPVCNQFSRSPGPVADIDLTIVECDACQLVQLGEVSPPHLLRPEVPWIRYREPEGHLEALVESLFSLRPDAQSAIGTGPFERPLLSRLAARGLVSRALELEPGAAAGRYPYLETWQASLNEPHLSAKAAQLGTFDIVSCRYVVEHTPEPVAALQALKRLLNPDGLLVVEVPDSSKFLAARDYCFLWEEHSCYFVEETFRCLAELSGFWTRALLRYPGVLEDALAVVLEATDAPVPAILARGPSRMFEAYRDGFASTREALRAKLAALAGPDRDRIALFGIGHHAIMFVNAFGLADLIAVAVDDDADKAGFFPPGFRTPVVGSERLLDDERIRLCLFAIAPHIEAKVREKLAPLAARGVEFRSIYAALDNSIMRDQA
ncbi:methyltransferase domain-containing protein [Bradyrhizobium sp. HKCCYLS3013]|uniref:class I SAM-dependent methyltransferase n=1 Tax=Bradyrhizobium sp. HKCCYLS3013 TaxID=3420735 RepID=UPI003EB9F4C7